MKTMSAPSSASQIFSVSSTAAWRPTSGLAPAPRPLVSLPPIWILTGARLARSACRSVLTAMNSTPWRPDGDHAADRVAAAAADAHHLDAGAVDLLLGELDAARTVVLFAHAPQIPSEQPVMNPQRRQMRLQWYATTAAPHISQGSSPASRRRPGPPPRRSRRAESATGSGGKARPSRFVFHAPLPQKKSDSQPMRRPVTLPKVPVAACREAAERAPGPVAVAAQHQAHRRRVDRARHHVHEPADARRACRAAPACRRSAPRSRAGPRGSRRPR